MPEWFRRLLHSLSQQQKDELSNYFSEVRSTAPHANAVAELSKGKAHVDYEDDERLVVLETGAPDNSHFWWIKNSDVFASLKIKREERMDWILERCVPAYISGIGICSYSIVDNCVDDEDWETFEVQVDPDGEYCPEGDA